MTTTGILIVVVIAVVLLAVVGLLVSSMRKRSRADDIARATQLRETADQRAAGLPETRARAEEAEVEAEQARLEAERAEEHAVEARRLADQEQAAHEDTIRAADRLDPEVDHRAGDYTPDTSAVEPPESTGTPAAAAPAAHPDTIFDADDTPGAGHTDGHGGSHRA